MAFTSSNHKLFEGCIDIKYTNQLSFECSSIEKDGENFKYEFFDDNDILPLPDWIYEEILRVKGSPKKQQKQSVLSSCCSSLHEHVHRSGESIDRESDITPESASDLNNEIRENKDWEILVEFFDRCYKPYRFENYDDWLHVGMAIKNRFGDKGFELWVYFSNKASVHDSEDELRKKYDTFDKKYPRPVKIYTLFHFAKEDNKEVYLEIIKKKSAFGEFQLDSTSIKHYIQCFRGHDFIWNEGLLYCFNGKYWVVDKDNTEMKTYIGEELYETLKEIYIHCYFDDPYLKDKRKKMESQLLKLRTLQFKKEIVETTKENLTIKQDIFDNNPYLLGFTNKVYDLQLGEFRDYLRSDMVSMTTGYDWEEPTVEQVKTMNDLIASIMPNEPERECYLRILATGLCGLCLEKFIVLNGKGRNGKGLTNGIYLLALGEYGFNANSAILTERKKTGCNPEIANLHKKRYVVTKEPSSREKIQNSVIKDFSGGGSFSARGLYESKTEKVNHMTLVVECNSKPLFAEKPQLAEMERVIDILFQNTFTDNEDDINTQLGVYRGNTKYKELSFQIKHRCAFLKIIMNAYKRYASDNRNLRVPNSIKLRSDAYLASSCELYQWILDNYEKTEKNTDIVKIRDMYCMFIGSEYCNNLSRAEKRKLSEKSFIADIIDCVFLRKHFYERKFIEGVAYRNILWGFKTPDLEILPIDA